MKKIGKISINPEKVIKNEELVNLRGGLGPYAVACKSPSTGETCYDFWYSDCGLEEEILKVCRYECDEQVIAYVCV